MQAESIFPDQASRRAREAGVILRFTAATIVGGITVAVLIHGMGRGSGIAPGERHEYPAFLAGTQDHIDYTFKVTNTTGRPVRILDCKSSCGCTSTELKKSSLLPGESTDLAVRMDVRDDTTENVAVVTLHTDHPRFPRWGYRLAARTYRPVWFEGPTLDLGEYDEESPRTLKGQAQLYLCGSWSRPTLPDLRWNLPPGIRVHINEATRSDERDGTWRITSYTADVELDLSGRSTLGDPISEFLSVRAQQGDPASLQLVAHRSWRNFAVMPTIAHFGSISQGGDVSIEVVIRSIDRSPFRVLSVASDNPAVEAAVTEDYVPDPLGQGADEYRLRLKLSAPSGKAEGGLLHGVIRLTLSSKDKPVLTIPWLADLVGPPA
ncbi:MAG: DUF1573 domain-containing protein [Isosphaeraceae bacterium]